VLLGGDAHVGHLTRVLAGGVAALQAQCWVLMAREAHWQARVLVAQVLLLLLLLLLLLHVTELLLPPLSLLTRHLVLVEHARVLHETRRQPTTRLLLWRSSLLVLHVLEHGHRRTTSRQVRVHHLRWCISWLLHKRKQEITLPLLLPVVTLRVLSGAAVQERSQVGVLRVGIS
jgi:hypothetical protein